MRRLLLLLLLLAAPAAAQTPLNPNPFFDFGTTGWVVGSGWTYNGSGGMKHALGPIGTLSQTGVVLTGAPYVVSVTMSRSGPSGSLLVTLGASSATVYNSTRVELLASGTVTLTVTPSSDCDCTVEGVAVLGTASSGAVGGGFTSPGLGIPVDTTGSSAWTARCIVGGAGISVLNGCGVAGNFTLSIDTATANLPGAFITSNYAQNGVPASVTRYGGLSVWGSAESDAALVIPAPCTARNFYMLTANAQPATGSLVMTIRNTTTGTDTAVTFTIAANGGAAMYSDTTHSVAFAAGDRLVFKAVNNATGTSALVQSIGVQCN